MLNSSADACPGKIAILPPVAHTQRGCDGVLELKLDALRDGERRSGVRGVLSNLAGGALGEGREALRPRSAKHRTRTPARKPTRMGLLTAAGSLLVASVSFFLRLLISGARMRMPFCPFITFRPSWFPRVEACYRGLRPASAVRSRGCCRSCSYGTGPWQLGRPSGLRSVLLPAARSGA